MDIQQIILTILFILMGIINTFNIIRINKVATKGRLWSFNPISYSTLDEDQKSKIRKYFTYIIIVIIVFVICVFLSFIFFDEVKRPRSPDFTTKNAISRHGFRFSQCPLSIASAPVIDL